jgi:predicted RNA-binding protein
VAYYLDLFSPDTYEAFSRSSQNVSGFRIRHENLARRVQLHDRFICYLTKLSRWCGVLEVTSGYFKDATPIFYPSDDPFIVRFRVTPLVWLPVEKSVPIKDPRLWQKLTFTREVEANSPRWTGKLRNSLNQLDDEDGRLIEEFMFSQSNGGEDFPVDREEYESFMTHRVRTVNKVISVSIPQDEGKDTVEADAAPPEVRESIRIQSLLAHIGDQIGMSIWIPRNDRGAVSNEWKGNHKPILEVLPLNYDESTLKTIEHIDVIWLRGRSIQRAFEVEHTTSIYSGLLRMADLLALQPNMDIKLHIVAPASRRDKVFQEITRPVFSYFERGALSERCTYLSYDSVRELATERHLAHYTDTVLDKYAESVEETN